MPGGIDLGGDRLEHLPARERLAASARRSPRCTLGRRDVVAPRRRPCAGVCAPGNARWIGSYVLHDRQRLRQVGEARQLRVQRQRRAARARAARRPRAPRRAPAGAARGRARSPRRATRRRCAGRGTGSAPCRRGARASPSTAGRIESEPISATATISIAPTAIEVKTALPVNSIPAIAISTVRPGDEHRVTRRARRS